MSAAESLKALGERQEEYGWPGPPVRELFDALPELVELVNTAEEPVWDRKHQKWVCGFCGASEWVEHRPKCALDALQKKLRANVQVRER